jgi:hypothetical protein
MGNRVWGVPRWTVPLPISRGSRVIERRHEHRFDVRTGGGSDLVRQRSGRSHLRDARHVHELSRRDAAAPSCFDLERHSSRGRVDPVALNREEILRLKELPRPSAGEGESISCVLTFCTCLLTNDSCARNYCWERTTPRSALNPPWPLEGALTKQQIRELLRRIETEQGWW